MREFIASRPVLQEMQEEILQAEGTLHSTETRFTGQNKEL